MFSHFDKQKFVLPHCFCALGQSCKFDLRCKNLYRIDPLALFQKNSATSENCDSRTFVNLCFEQWAIIIPVLFKIGNHWSSLILKMYQHVFAVAKTFRLDSNIESKSSNNTYLNFFEILFFPVLRTSNQNFCNNIDLRKQGFLSAEIISHRSHFVYKA